MHTISPYELNCSKVCAIVSIAIELETDFYPQREREREGGERDFLKLNL